MGGCMPKQLAAVRIHSIAEKGKKYNSLRTLVTANPESVDAHVDKRGETALAVATANHRLEAMQILLEGGATPRTTNTTGWTPLITAAANNFPEGVELLLRYGADPSYRARGKTALDWAKQTGSRNCVQILEKSPDALVQRLVDMGFEREEAKATLERFNGDFEPALQSLIDHQLEKVKRARRNSSFRKQDGGAEGGKVGSPSHRRQSSDKAAELPPPQYTPAVEETSGGGNTTATGDDDDDDNECVVCLCEARDTAFVPCGHLCACYTCASQLSSCPLCRKPKQMALKVFK